MKSGLHILVCGLMLGWSAWTAAQEPAKEAPAAIELKDLKSADLTAPIAKYLATDGAKDAVATVQPFLAGPLEKAPIVLVLEDGIPRSVTWKCLKPGLNAADTKTAQGLLRSILTNALGQANLLQEVDAAKAIADKLIATPVEATGVVVEPKPVVPKPPVKGEAIPLSALTESTIRDRVRSYLLTKEGQSLAEPLADALPTLSPTTLFYEPAFGNSAPKSLVWRSLKVGAAPAVRTAVEAKLKAIVSNALVQHPEPAPSNLFIEVNGAAILGLVFSVQEIGSAPATTQPTLPTADSFRMPQEPLAIGISGWTYPPYYGFSSWYGAFYPSYSYYGYGGYYGYGYGYGVYPFGYYSAPGYFAPVYAPRWYGGYVFPPVAPYYSAVSGNANPADVVGDADTLYGRGRNRYFEGRYADAVTILKAAIRKDSDDSRMWYFLSLSQKSLGQNAEAVESARRGQAVELVNGRDDRLIDSLEKVQGQERVFLRTQRETRMTRDEARAIVSRPVDVPATRVADAK